MGLKEALLAHEGEQKVRRAPDESIIDAALRDADDETHELLMNLLLSDAPHVEVAEILTEGGYPIRRTAVGDYRRALRAEGA